MSNNYPYYEIAKFDHFRDFVNGMERMYAGRTACVFYTPDGEECAYSYKALCDDVNGLGAALCGMGLAGKHVALVGENSYPWIVSLLAITSIGGVVVPLDSEQTGEVILRMITRGDAKAAIFSGAFDELFLAGRSEADPLVTISMGECSAHPHHKYAELVAYGKRQTEAGSPDPRKIEIDRDQTAMIVYTSGTTSTSKPVALSHYNILYNAVHGSAMIDMGERIYTSLPLYHTYGLTCGVINHFSQGHTMGVNGHMKRMLRDLLLFKPDCALVVPLIAEAILARVRGEIRKRGMDQDPDYLAMLDQSAARPTPALTRALRPIVDELYGSGLNKIVSGGAHLNGDVERQLGALGMTVFQGYGITECSPLISVNRNLANQFGSVGFVLPETEIQFVEGEIWVRGPGVSQGYYGDSELTRESFADGWFKTGDMGHVDKSGFLFITHRKKNLIVFKNGKKVAPEEIEHYAQAVPMIKEAMAYGATTGRSQDDVKLALMVYPDPEITHGMSESEVLQRLQKEIDAINAKLPAYKRIQTLKLRDTEFEKTATRKIKRYVL